MFGGKFIPIFTCLAYLVWETRGASVPKIEYAFGKIPYNPGVCNSATKGNLRMVKDRSHFNKLLLCTKKETHFYWKMMSNSGNSYGNYFDPAKDCSSILDKIPEAKSGIYWIKTNKEPRKAWCDLVTDGGGFMLIGVQNSSRTMDVPSDRTLVHPLDLRHWSSAFGDENISDFRVQISTSKSWSDTKAHWYYRFNKPRKLSNLLLFDDGDCDDQDPGVGDVKFVKDLRDNSVVTKQFECSRFDSYFHKNFGWGKMNQCFRSPCKIGFNHFNLATSGAFSFSVKSRKSGITDTSTQFIGCEKGKCCACFGGSSDKDYCAPGCKPINGGTVLDDDDTEIHAWYWVRNSLPKRVWKKCMEYDKINEAGKMVKWHVDERTWVPKEGPCSYPGDVKFYDGIAVVDNKKALEKLQNISGLLSYRSDNEELYLREKHDWKILAKEEEVEELQTDLKTSEKELADLSYKSDQLDQKLKEKLEKSQKELVVLSTKSDKRDQELQTKLETSQKELAELSAKVLKLEQVLENAIYSSCKSALDKGIAKHGVFKIRSPSYANGYTSAYCHMTSLPGCSGGGWTLVMKVDGRKETFHYDSSYWSNKAVYNHGGGLTGFDDQETKLPTYWDMPFKEICLGMKVGNDLNFISIRYPASSLYDLIADGRYRATSIGRSKWLSLVQGSDLQPNCNREGFNAKVTGYSRVRLGILGNNQNDCTMPDSSHGFGSLSKDNRLTYCGAPKTTNTCGNVAYCSPSRGGDKEIPAMGYILVR